MYSFHCTLVTVYRAWRDLALVNRQSAFQLEVSSILYAMGIPHELEWLTQSGRFSIDVALYGGQGQVAIEVDGPYHFTLDGKPLGHTLLRLVCSVSALDLG